VVKMYGDPEKLASYVVDKVLKETEPEIGKALNDAVKLLEQAYSKILEETRERIALEYNRVLDEIRSVEATLEKETKLELSKRRSSEVEDVVKKAVEKLKEVPREDKLKIYINLAADFAQKAQEEETYRVLVKKGEASLVKKAFSDKKVAGILKEKKVKIGIEEGLKTNLGGFRAESSGGKVVLDYTLELIVASLFPKLSGTASRVLFEE